jgi:hypothetical protein
LALGIAMADRPPACLPAGRASALRHHVGGRGGGWAWGRHVGRTRETCRAANRRDRVICGDGEGSSLPRVGRDHTSPSIGSQVARIGGFATATRWATRCAARGGNGRSGSPSPLLAGPVPQMRSRQWRGLAGSGMHYCIFDVGSTGFSISVYSLLVERLPRCPGLASGPRFRRTGNARSGSDRLPDAWHR